MPVGAKKTLGNQGEQIARNYLIARGYSIETMNWHCAHGEIDIIARQGETLVFVEVRTRRVDTEAAFESITPRKQSKLHKLAYAYLNEHGLDDTPWRIDLIAIAIPYRGQPIIEHREDGLAWE